MISRILVPMDDSEMAKQALEYALENHPDADITVLHVAGTPSRWGGAATSLALEDDVEAGAEDRAEDVFDDARDLAAEYGRQITTEVQVGHPARVILNAVEEYDAVVIGSHGGSLVDRLIVGNVAKQVVHNSPVSVIVAR
ncbi:universal stress protein [Haloparvum alkalitolerans]|uniref:universal stress protein n=1 Tax=Haloparvum alkalitolerans TaxID=1042953 RepID=UPI003CF917AB